jgi:membrane protein implicated in regulation of membrane protease activity
MPTTGKQTTTAAPPPPPPPSRRPAPQPPPSPKPPPPAGNQLVGAEGKVTVAIDNSTQTGEVEIRGQLYPAQSESGEPLPEGTPVVVVRRDAEFLYVAPR